MSIDLGTDYLGLALKNPLVPSASPLSKNLDSALRLEDAGAAALVMHSLFEESIVYEQAHLERFVFQQELGHGEAQGFYPLPDSYQGVQEQYLEQLRALKARLAIPVIASLNGVSNSGWLHCAKALEEAGADAIELNVYYVAAQGGENSQDVEQRYVDLLSRLRAQVSLPLTVKLSSQFSAPIDLIGRLEQAGAQGVALFNRFYQPDIDLETLQVNPTLVLSSPAECLLRIRWAAILFGRTRCSLAITGGVHGVDQVIKGLLAGADVMHLCSALLRDGPQRITEILQQLQQWMEQREYSSVAQLKGSVSQQHAADPAAFTRANYLQVLDSFSTPSGVWR